MALPNNYFQQTLENEFVTMQALSEEDFDALYAVASDPLIWAQHPNKNRYELAEFQNYFKGAIASKGAYLVFDKANGDIVGSSRFYDYSDDERSVFIGYTFVARKYWGKGMNQAMKSLMMQHAFEYVDKILFHVGANNKRSQIAMERLGGTKTKEVEVAYYGEPVKVNFEYVIEKL